MLGKIYQNIRRCLEDLKRAGLVDSEHVKRYVPGIAWILMNEWFLTPRGEEWVKKRKE